MSHLKSLTLSAAIGHFISNGPWNDAHWQIGLQTRRMTAIDTVNFDCQQLIN